MAAPARRSRRRYFGEGFLAAIVIGAVFLGAAIYISRRGSAAVPAQPPAPRSEAVETVSSTPPAPTLTASPVATFTVIPPWSQPANIPAGFDPAVAPTSDPIAHAVNAGEMIFTGPLSHAQQANLYRASLTYVRSNVADSKVEAKEINGVGYGDPNNICGPLAIAILRDGGVIAPEIVPHDFWLLNPPAPTDQRILARAFPVDLFVHTRVSTPLNKMDWTASPLEPGDFLFIWHGSWGNFDHMLVVNRVDAAMRAYAVTNYGTPDGFIIAETLLYDPKDPTAGIFHTWTQARDQILGSTGFGGYELWRLHTP